MGRFIVEFYEEAGGRRPVEDWLNHDLSEVQLAAVVEGIRVILAERGVDVCASSFGKALGQGLYEFRRRRGPPATHPMEGGPPPPERNPLMAVPAVDIEWAITHNSPHHHRGGPAVPRTFDDYLADSPRVRQPEVERYRKAFEGAYTVALQLHDLRKQRGITQAVLAEMSGVDQGDISRIERGVIEPTTGTLAKLVTALGAELRIVETG